MNIDGWSYYNHAAIPTSAPNEDVNILPIKNKSIWKIDGGTPLLARWTTAFDCGYETSWWYVIKDRPFNISELKAKRRYEINKGKRNFDVKEIDPLKYLDNLFEVTKSAYSGWDKKYRPIVEKDTFYNEVKRWSWYKVFGVFSKGTDRLCGYALLSKKGKYVGFNVLRVSPEYERLGANAVVIATILELHEAFLLNGGYICDGERSISHETAFQDYLEKYFSFRKAYCKLHLQYNPKIKWIIKILYPFRKVFIRFDNIGLVHQINSLFKMQNILNER